MACLKSAEQKEQDRINAEIEKQLKKDKKSSDKDEESKANEESKGQTKLSKSPFRSSGGQT